MELKKFLNEGYTSFHVTQNVCDYLTSCGFVRLSLSEEWKLKRGGKYFVTRNGSSVIAFTVGQKDVFNVAECHTDSPSFRVKGNKAIAGDVLRLNTEKYGGGLLYTFFDRPLKIAGRIAVATEQGVACQTVTSKYNVVIPSVAIHLNRGVNDNFAVNTQVDTLPLFSCTQKDLYATLTDKKVLDADLYVVPATQAFNSGTDNEFLCSARLDNLTGVYCCVTALTEVKPSSIAVAACLDNEEVGSGTHQGSPSFIETVLDGICAGLNLPQTAAQSAREKGMVLSVDNGHARHPAHQEKSDPVSFAVMGGGIAVKHHVNYATDAISSAVFKRILAENGVKYQDLYGRSDASCGTTLGLSTSRQLGMKTCDVGIAQLAMHSACETCSVEDVHQLQKGLRAFLSADIDGNDQEITVK